MSEFGVIKLSELFSVQRTMLKSSSMVNTHTHTHYLIVIHHREGVLVSGYDMVTVLALICEEKIMGKGFTLWFCLRRSYDERYFTQVTILTYLLKSLRREGEKGKRARQPDYRNKRHEKREKNYKMGRERYRFRFIWLQRKGNHFLKKRSLTQVSDDLLLVFIHQRLVADEHKVSLLTVGTSQEVHQIRAVIQAGVSL